MIQARNQHGEVVALEGKHPRKELLEALGVKRADRIYRDKADGRTVHVGYITRQRGEYDQWWTLYNVSPWEREV